MLTGTIQALPKTLQRDRSDQAYTLWEQNAKPNKAELPWLPAASFDVERVRELLSSAKTVVVGGSRGSLHADVLASLRPGVRAYAYGSPTIEADRSLVQALAKASDRIVMRLGYDLPADWVVVDGGRAGVLFVGPPAEERRWAIQLEPALARSLFEAFRVLFWHHARREGLPDASRSFAFRPPLGSPYADPGKDVPLPAGRLVIDGSLLDLVPDADFRIAPDGPTKGRTFTALFPPDTGAFDAARRLASTGARVVWTDLGLPRTTISRQRLVMDLVQGPVGIQLEWGAGTAVDTFHRVNKACEAPKWTFHPQRRLREIEGLVLLEGATSPAPAIPEERIDLPDLRSPLASFETAEPTDLRLPPPLARHVVYAWRTVPPTVPQGAGKAQIMRQWTALDEWMSGGVRTLRQRLDSMEGEERGVLSRLRGLLRGQDLVQRERSRIRDALVEIGEQPPSQRSDAGEVVRRLVEEAGKIRGLLQQAHKERQDAEDSAEEAEQRRAWQVRVDSATNELTQKRAELVGLEENEGKAEAATHEAEAAVTSRSAELRAARMARLREDRDRDEALLATARTKLSALDAEHHGKAPKEERRLLTTEIGRLEPLVASSKRELAALDKWAPPANELAQENGRLNQARDRREALRKARASISADLTKLERAAAESFAPRPGARLPAVSVPDLATAPTVPSESPPELGELFEHQGQRFLAVRTWEQVNRAGRVASRLHAELVAFPDSTKK